jgi:hypothetical protein
VIGIAWWLSRIVEGKTYYGSLTPGVDPVSSQGQAEFDTRRQRDAEKRKIIYWAAGIIALGYLGALGWSTFTLRASAAQPTITPTLASTFTPSPLPLTQTPTPVPFTLTFTPTLKTGTPTYLPTATDRIIYLAGKQSTVVVTVIVTRKIYVIVTSTFTSSPTPTLTPSSTLTDTPTGTATSTSIATEGE